MSNEIAQETEKCFFLKTGGFLTQVNYSNKFTFGSLHGLSSNTGDL